jgi:hypothetical protein
MDGGSVINMLYASTLDDMVQDRLGDQRGGSEWEPIKILLEGD